MLAASTPCGACHDTDTCPESVAPLQRYGLGHVLSAAAACREGPPDLGVASDAHCCCLHRFTAMCRHSLMSMPQLHAWRHSCRQGRHHLCSAVQRCATCHIVLLLPAGSKLDADRSSVHTLCVGHALAIFIAAAVCRAYMYGGDAVSMVLLCSRCTGSYACCTCWILCSRG